MPARACTYLERPPLFESSQRKEKPASEITTTILEVEGALVIGLTFGIGSCAGLATRLAAPYPTWKNESRVATSRLAITMAGDLIKSGHARMRPSKPALSSLNHIPVLARRFDVYHCHSTPIARHVCPTVHTPDIHHPGSLQMTYICVKALIIASGRLARTLRQVRLIIRIYDM